MITTEPVPRTMYIDSQPDSHAAIRLLDDAGVCYNIIDVGAGDEPVRPQLFTHEGIWPGLQNIRCYISAFAVHSTEDEFDVVEAHSAEAMARRCNELPISWDEAKKSL